MNDYKAESYEGISRVEHPEWEGWKEIDRHKTMHGFPDNLKFSNVLADAVRNFSLRPEENEINRRGFHN